MWLLKSAHWKGRPSYIIRIKVHLGLTLCADMGHGGVTGPDYSQISGMDLLIRSELPQASVGLFLHTLLNMWRWPKYEGVQRSGLQRRRSVSIETPACLRSRETVLADINPRPLTFNPRRSAAVSLGVCAAAGPSRGGGRCERAVGRPYRSHTML